MAFDTYDCTVCDESFTAYPESNATDGPHCSPSCEIAGKELS